MTEDDTLNALAIKSVLTIASLLVMSGCGSLPEAGSTDAKFYASRCGECHQPPLPGDQFVFQWERLITMIERGVLHREMKPLTTAEAQQVRNYLSRHGKPNPPSIKPEDARR